MTSPATLCSVSQVQHIPGVANQPTLSVSFLSDLVTYATSAIQKFCKRDLFKNDYTEFYSGDDTREIVLRQWPVLTVNHLFFDPGGYYGFPPQSFSPGTELVQGNQYVLELDSGGTKSNRGLVLRIAGAQQGFIGFYPENFYAGKLAAYRLATWPRGDGNLKVQYTAGYDPIPDDLAYSCATLVAWMARNMPLGSPLNSESLNGYSYSAVVNASLGSSPELGDAGRVLRRYREVTW